MLGQRERFKSLPPAPALAVLVHGEALPEETHAEGGVGSGAGSSLPQFEGAERVSGPGMLQRRVCGEG